MNSKWKRPMQQLEPVPIAPPERFEAQPLETVRIAIGGQADIKVALGMINDFAT
jgi:hypothetical protein